MSATAVGLEYLTVQDVLWINLQATKRTNAFNYATLEEATFYQYGYGGSTDLLGQASRFLTGFLKKAPFGGHGDDVTAFLATHAFLAINGYDLEVPTEEYESWIERVKSGQIVAGEAITQLSKESGHGHAPSPIEAMRAALAKYHVA